MLAVGHFAWDGLMRRLDADPLDDLRWQYLRYGLDAMQAWLPWGSGLGTFPWVYAPMEPLAAMGPTFAERAHNDLLQIAIEAGIPGCPARRRVRGLCDCREGSEKFSHGAAAGRHG